MKKALVGVLVACGMVMLTGCAVAKSLDFDSEEAAQNALDTASVVRFDGDDIKEVHQTGNIYADGKVAGFLQEEGFLNSQIIISMNDNTWMYQKIVEDEPSSEELPGEAMGSTYGIFDANDNGIAYVQERLMETDVFPRAYYLVFLDVDGNPTGYLADEEGKNVYDFDGNLVCTGSAQMNGVLGTDYNVEITMEPGTDAQIDFAYKLGLYAKLYYDLRSWYSLTYSD